MLFEPGFKSLVGGVPCKATVFTSENGNHMELISDLTYPMNNFDIVEKGFVQLSFLLASTFSITRLPHRTSSADGTQARNSLLNTETLM